MVDHVLALDEERRRLETQVGELRNQRNVGSKQIGASKDPEARERMKTEMREVGDRISAIDVQLNEVNARQQELMLTIPNLPHPDVPVGRDESENILVRTVGEPRQFDFEPKPHWEIGVNLGILDIERGVKISGSRFYVLKGAGAALQRALIAWFLDVHIRQHDYEEIYPPFVVREHCLVGTGQLPKFGDNLYRDHEEDYYMVPTAEVPLTGMHMEEILEEAALPLKYTAYTPCFRREKMSAGRDVRGIKRGHQFDKVEMYAYTRPEDSPAALDQMVADAEETCRLLGFTYRIHQLCTGDLGFNSHITYDIEVWAAGSEEWLEVSSVSNVGEFQARRSGIRYRRADGGRTAYPHTLNGSGLGLPRTLIAVLENNQQADGSVVVPEVLRPWMGGIEKIG